MRLNEYIENEPTGNIFKVMKGSKLLQIKRKCNDNQTCLIGDINSVNVTDINEENKPMEYGCLMLMLNIPNWVKLLNIISKEDIYDEPGFGLEKEPHVTVLYGFHDNVDVEDIKKTTTFFKSPIQVKVLNISKFENEKFDVLKFAVESASLDKMNEIMTFYPHTNSFPDYNQHVTIAYLKKGTADKYLKELSDKNEYLKSKSFEYSYITDENEKWQIDNNQTSNSMEGGLGDNKKVDGFNFNEVLKGIQIEKEHTDKISQALEITIDHLSEFKDYYTNILKEPKE